MNERGNGGPAPTSPDDLLKELRRLLGVVEDVKCAQCNVARSFREMYLVRRSGILAFLCEKCAARHIDGPIRRGLALALRSDPRVEELADELAAAALGKADLADRERAFEELRALLGFLRANGEGERQS
jgi:hypothetical protein